MITVHMWFYAIVFGLWIRMNFNSRVIKNNKHTFLIIQICMDENNKMNSKMKKLNEKKIMKINKILNCKICN